MSTATEGFVAIEIDRTLAQGMGLPARRIVVSSIGARRVVDGEGRIDLEALADEADAVLSAEDRRVAIHHQAPTVARVALFASRLADREGRFDDALRLATMATAWAPQDLECVAARSIAQARVGRHDDALFGYMEVLEGDSDGVATGLRVLAVRSALEADRPLLARRLAEPLRGTWEREPEALTRLLAAIDQAVGAGEPEPETPADWYPDPTGAARLRYWDGAEWTDHTAE